MEDASRNVMQNDTGESNTSRSVLEIAMQASFLTANCKITGGKEKKNSIKHYFEAKDLQTKRQIGHIVQIFHPSIPE